MPVCANCKQQCGYYEQYGLFYCNACDTQSQTMQVMTADDEVPTTKVSNVYSHRIKQKEVRKTAAYMPVKMRFHKKTVPGAWKYQAMQCILQAQVKTLIQMGVTERLNDIVGQLWFLYLHKLNIAFCGDKEKALQITAPDPETARAAGPSTSQEQETQDSEPGSPSIISRKVFTEDSTDFKTPVSLKQDSRVTMDEHTATDMSALETKQENVTTEESTSQEDEASDLEVLLQKIREYEDADESPVPVKKKKVKRTKKEGYLSKKNGVDAQPCVRNLLCLVYLGLRFTHEPILLSDLIRLVHENNLPFWYSEDIIPQELTKEKPPEFAKLFVVSTKKKTTLSHIGFMKRLGIMRKLLCLPTIPCPDMAVVIARYVAMLNLPNELNHFTYKLFSQYNPSLDEGVFAHDIIALAFITVALRLLFILDNKVEHELSEKAQRLRHVSSVPIFVWDEWVCAVEIRKTQKIAEGITTDSSDVCQVKNMDNFLTHYLKCSRTESFKDIDVKCSQKHNHRGCNQNAWEMRQQRQKCFKFLDKQTINSTRSHSPKRSPKKTKRKATPITAEIPRKKKKITYKMQQVAKSKQHSEITWEPRENLINVDFSEFSMKYLFNFDHFCEEHGLENDKTWLVGGTKSMVAFDLKLSNRDTETGSNGIESNENGEVKIRGKTKSVKSRRKHKTKILKSEGKNKNSSTKPGDGDIEVTDATSTKESAVEGQKKKHNKRSTTAKSKSKKDKKKKSGTHSKLHMKSGSKQTVSSSKSKLKKKKKSKTKMNSSEAEKDVPQENRLEGGDAKSKSKKGEDDPEHLNTETGHSSSTTSNNNTRKNKDKKKKKLKPAGHRSSSKSEVKTKKKKKKKDKSADTVQSKHENKETSEGGSKLKTKLKTKKKSATETGKLTANKLTNDQKIDDELKKKQSESSQRKESASEDDISVSDISSSGSDLSRYMLCVDSAIAARFKSNQDDNKSANKTMHPADNSGSDVGKTKDKCQIETSSSKDVTSKKKSKSKKKADQDENVESLNTSTNKTRKKKGSESKKKKTDKHREQEKTNNSDDDSDISDKKITSEESSSKDKHSQKKQKKSKSKITQESKKMQADKADVQAESVFTAIKTKAGNKKKKTELKTEVLKKVNMKDKPDETGLGRKSKSKHKLTTEQKVTAMKTKTGNKTGKMEDEIDGDSLKRVDVKDGTDGKGLARKSKSKKSKTSQKDDKSSVPDGGSEEKRDGCKKVTVKHRKKTEIVKKATNETLSASMDKVKSGEKKDVSKKVKVKREKKIELVKKAASETLSASTDKVKSGKKSKHKDKKKRKKVSSEKAKSEVSGEQNGGSEKKQDRVSKKKRKTKLVQDVGDETTLKLKKRKKSKTKRDKSDVESSKQDVANKKTRKSQKGKKSKTKSDESDLKIDDGLKKTSKHKGRKSTKNSIDIKPKKKRKRKLAEEQYNEPMNTRSKSKVTKTSETHKISSADESDESDQAPVNDPRYPLLTPDRITGKYPLADMSDSFRWLVQLCASLIGVDTEHMCIAVHDVELLVLKTTNWVRNKNRKGVVSNWGCRE